MTFWDEFPGPNAAYVLELYNRYRQDPNSVDASTRAYFEHWAGPPELEVTPALTAPTLAADKVVGAANLARAIRAYGHLAAQLDPLGHPPSGDPSLELATHGLTENDLRGMPASLVGGPLADGADGAESTPSTANAWEALRRLREVYTSTTGYDYGHIHGPSERDWLRHAAESRRFQPTGANLDAEGLLRQLTRVEVFEQFLHRTFQGKTRFSLEGLDMLVPMLIEIICAAASSGMRSALLGMAHRGRLNVMANVLEKPIKQILAEFKDPAHARNVTVREELGWTGDVKYHLGALLPAGDEYAQLSIIMPPNPSHVEAIDPVVVGMARAAGTRADQAGAPAFDAAVALPLLIHGDAAFPGEGIVAETLNLSRLPGYQTGGTLHLIANNQLGYTTLPQSGRSTLYASDLAKGFEIPIVHVNADDPEACLQAARLALAYRAQFHKDFLIDLIGYRRWGHNEGDEPGFTQPLMYQQIAQHPGVREIWAKTLVTRGLIDESLAERLVEEERQRLQGALDSLRPEEDLNETPPQLAPRGAARRVQTAVPLGELQELNEALLRVPEGFALNPKLERPMRRRRQALSDPDTREVDWATAEQLAFATILRAGTAIRLTGEDVARGTFGQRHAVFHDVKTGDTFTPLQAMPQARAAFAVYDSPLSENAALGFEYGYNVQQPAQLVIWEAQYADFVNEAQVMIDEFIVAARAKWGQTPSLVLLLPHASEGQGPDHSSGRLERFLQLAAETNMRIAYPTTAAQYFHLLRRQALLLETDPLPLVVFTPKSLLRHAQAASTPRELAEGGWQAVIDDAETRDAAGEVRRLILCSGKVYVDLTGDERRKGNRAVAIVRVEQLYPFPGDELRSVLDAYPQATELIWLQEEPENMGAWTFTRPQLEELLNGRIPLRYIGRPPNSSPAEGSSSRYAMNQKQLIESAFDRNGDNEHVREHSRAGVG